MKCGLLPPDPRKVSREVRRIYPILHYVVRPIPDEQTARLDQADHGTPLVGAVTDATRSQHELILENALLRQRLIVQNRQVKRPRLRGRDRAVIVGLAGRLATWKNALLIVKPETVLRWHIEQPVRDVLHQIHAPFRHVIHTDFPPIWNE